MNTERETLLNNTINNLLDHAVNPLWEAATRVLDDDQLAEIDETIAEAVEVLGDNRDGDSPWNKKGQSNER